MSVGDASLLSARGLVTEVRLEFGTWKAEKRLIVTSDRRVTGGRDVRDSLNGDLVLVKNGA